LSNRPDGRGENGSRTIGPANVPLPPAALFALLVIGCGIVGLVIGLPHTGEQVVFEFDNLEPGAQ